ncbi:MAG: 50S ribosomal protein L13 [Bacteroidia bacterium]|nr:50S ribosomal protein L13 [Bacteroidia bacterium]
MDTLSYKTVSANKATVKKEWILVDAKDQVVGRLASKLALILRGKHKADYTPHVDCGDNVVVINADKVVFTGKKWTDKRYFTHSGYPGSQKRVSPKQVFDKNNIAILEWAVRGMLPKNKLGDQLFKNLHVYVGTEHKQEAQLPKEIDLNTIK